MIEKRFTVADGFKIVAIRDNGEIMNSIRVCDKLNELADENEQLRTALKELKEIGDYQADRIQELNDENEQLKNKIDVLEDDNETYHKSLEKLNLYTKRFIPTKCTNEFKDCKTNRYYWLDHEGNFEGCLELLNLLDCERELLESENSHLKAKLMDYEDFKKLVYLVLKKEYDLRTNEMNIFAKKEDWQGYGATKLERGTVQRIAKRLGVDLE